MPGRARIAAAFLSAVLLAGPATHAGSTKVFRCTADDGAIELSQIPCPSDTSEQEITVIDLRTGWTPPASTTSSPKSFPDKRRRGSQTSREKADAAAAKRADRCWDKRRQLDEVNWKLRRGYRPAEGVRLRRKRQTY